MGQGDKWLAGMLSTLETGCDILDLSMFQESPEEAALRTGPTPQAMAFARNIFKGICRMPGPGGAVITKDQLVQAHRGDFKIFEKVKHIRRRPMCVANLGPLFESPCCSSFPSLSPSFPLFMCTDGR